MGIICDFCSSPEVRWAFPARDFVRGDQLHPVGMTTDGAPARQSEELQTGSEGGWAACNECAALIRAGDRDGLARRFAKRGRKRIPGAHLLTTKTIIGLIRPIHDQFWTNREGDPVPVTPGDQEDPTR